MTPRERSTALLAEALEATVGHGYGDTPTAALAALAERLREVAR